MAVRTAENGAITCGLILSNKWRLLIEMQTIYNINRSSGEGEVPDEDVCSDLTQ